MPKYKLPCSWTMSDEIEIEADHLADAINKAYSEYTSLPAGYYVDDSFQVDLDLYGATEGKECDPKDYERPTEQVQANEDMAILFGEAFGCVLRSTYSPEVKVGILKRLYEISTAISNERRKT